MKDANGNNSDREDLDWLAFQFVAGELDAAQSEAFLQRLGDDQQAREAVARAVRLTQAVAAVDVECRTTPTTAASNSRGLWAAGLAAVALVALLLLWHPAEQTSERDPHNGRQFASQPAPRRLVEAWTAAELADDESDEGFREYEPLDLEKFFGEHEPAADEPTVEVPDWLVAAVAADLAEGNSDSSNPPQKMN